jgi:hypothetical protein
MDDLVIPAVRRAPRLSRAELGHFVDDVGYDGFAHFLAAYRAAMGQLPPVDEVFDVATTFGTVRAYRFDGAGGTPVVLLPGRNASAPRWRVNLPSLLTHRTSTASTCSARPACPFRSGRLRPTIRPGGSTKQLPVWD